MADRKLRELSVPPDALEDPDAIEVARVWAAAKTQHISIKVDQWNDPAAWGLLLVDIAHHVANAFHEEDGYAVEAVLARIKEGFDGQWEEVSR